MKLDNWTKYNKMEHNVLLMALKNCEKILFCLKKVADIIIYRAFIMFRCTGRLQHM